MASYVRALLHWNRVTNLPEDIQTNTLHFKSNALTAVGLVNTLQPFLQTWMQAVSPNMPSSLFTTTALVKYYDMTDPEPRVPIDQNNVTIALSAGAALPEEVSMVLSYQAIALSGTPQARRRGRIYLPTMTSPIATVTGGRVEWASATRTSIANATTTFKGSCDSNDCDWNVYSPTIFALTSDLDDALAPVDNGWIDNSPDTQRRRGHGPTARTAWL